MRFENKSGSKRKKKKRCFVTWKAYFYSFIIIIILYPLHFKDNFENLR
jgi:hypothetical protein